MSAPAEALENPVTSDREMVERFRQGDREAFTELYRLHHPAVFRFAFAMTGDRSAAGEITQDVFVWLIHHASSFDPERGELPAFLGGIARKFVHQRRRDAARWLPLETGAIDRAAAPTDHAIDTGALKTAIARLPQRYREAVVLCELESKTYEEAARFLGCAVGTIRSRLHRGRELLARKLMPEKRPKRWWQ